ncbi:MAG: iron-sulfur cluster repair di-iron protein [Verrucomicrobiota bacterium]
MAERTVGELVAQRPGRSRIFQRHGIDFCCQGGRTLGEACDGRGVAVEAVLGELAAELAEPADKLQNPAQLPLHELCAYIIETHHGYLRRELPRLRTMAQRVADVHGGHTPSLIEVASVCMTLADELASHVLKEENILFPAIVAMSSGQSCSMPLDGPIACMLHEHEEAGQALARLRELTNGFHAPAAACNTYRALFAGLLELEDDLHHHIHLENSVVFPQAQAMVA